jgi:hypothetical protein
MCGGTENPSIRCGYGTEIAPDNYVVITFDENSRPPKYTVFFVCVLGGGGGKRPHTQCVITAQLYKIQSANERW